MNVKMTCKECGQLKESPARITKLENDENGRFIELEFRSQVAQDRSLLDVFMQQGVEIKRTDSTLVFTAKAEIITENAPETTSTPAPQTPSTAKRRGRPPAILKVE